MVNAHECSFSASDRLADSNLKVELRDGDFTALHHFFRSSSEDPLDVLVEITRFELTGLYWTPLWKSGQCAYEVRITSADPEVNGTLTGSIEKQAYGLYSAHSYRASLHEAVRETALEAIEE